MKGNFAQKFLFVVFIMSTLSLASQGNRLSIQPSTPSNLVVCTTNDTCLIKTFNISTSAVTGIQFTITLPTGVEYIPGSLKGAGIVESNISNKNKPVFSGSNIVVGGNVKFRISILSNCDVIGVLNSGVKPQIKVRVDYTGNYDEDKSAQFEPKVPAPAVVSISNSSFTGSVDDVFIRKIKLTNNGKGPIQLFYFKRKYGNGITIKTQTGFSKTIGADSILNIFGKAEFAQVGDKDSFLEQNEFIEITDTITIKKCINLNTANELYWGCGSKFCQITKSSSTVLISTNNPKISIVLKPTASTCLEGKTASLQTLMIYNNGNYPAKNLESYIYIPTYIAKTRIDTSSVTIRIGWKGTKSKPKLDSTTILTAAICNNTNKIMSFRIKYAALKQGDTLYLSWNTYSCLDNICNAYQYDQGWMYTYAFDNQCGSKYRSVDAWGRVYNYTTASVNAFTPSDIKNNEKKDFKFLFTTFGNFPLHDSAKITVDFVLPTSLTHSLSTSDFYLLHQNGATQWKPNSLKMVNDTLRADFGNVFKFNLLNAELVVSLTGKCTGLTTNKAVTYKLFYYYNTNKLCNPGLRITQICNTYTINMHCSNSCAGGMKFTDFWVQRTNFGKPDNNNDGKIDGSGSLDFNKIRTERVLFGDTLTTVFTGRPQKTNTIDSWKYGFAQSTIDYGAYLDVVDAQIQIINNGNLITSSCFGINKKRTNSGVNATFNFNFSIDTIKQTSGCIPANYKFNSKDSVRLIVRYKVARNIGGASYTIKFANRFYLATAANPTAAQSFQCDTFGGNMILYGYYFTNYGPESVVSNTCADINMSQYFYLGIGPCCQNYGGNNLFPFEYRNFAKVKSLILKLPAGLLIKNTDMYQSRTSGSGAITNEYNYGISYSSPSNNIYTYNLGNRFTDSSGSINLSDDGFHGGLLFKFVPSCMMAKNKLEKIEYKYVFERKNSFGKGFDTITAALDDITFQVPELKLAAINPFIKSVSDTVQWKIQLSNASNTLIATNSWFAIKNKNVKILNVKENGPDTLINSKNGLYKAGSTKVSQTRNFTITAIHTGCNLDSIMVYSAFDCIGYPDSLVAFPCNKDSLKLYVEPQMAKLQISISDKLNNREICDTNEFTIKIENIEAGTLLGAKLKLEIPTGLNIIPGSTLLEYPSKAGLKSVSGPVLQSGINYDWNISLLNPLLQIGFTGINDTNRNTIILKFKANTDCEKFVSGSTITAKVEGAMKCGAQINSSIAVSRPQNINGVKTPYYSFVKLKADTFFPCEKPMKLITKILILGPGKTTARDGIAILAPDGMTRDTNYYKPVKNAAAKWQFARKKIGAKEETFYKIPEGINPGDSIVFETQFISSTGIVPCSKLYFSAETNIQQELVCIATKKACDLSIPTGKTSDSTYVKKTFFVIDQASINTKVLGSDSEEIAMGFLLQNFGSGMDSTSKMYIKYLYDSNNSGTPDNSDLLLTKDLIKEKLKNGASTVVYKTLKVKAGQSCRLFAVIDSGVCACQKTIFSFGIPPIKNAGNDTFICSGSPVKLGINSVNGFSYSWNDNILIDLPGTSNPTFSGFSLSGQFEKREFILETNRGICITYDTVYVSVYPGPVLTNVVHKKEICEGESLNLDASIVDGTPQFKFQWTPSNYLNNAKSKSTSCTPLQSIKYKLSVIDSVGCKSEDTSLIIVNPKPDAWFRYSPACRGEDPMVFDSSSVRNGAVVNYKWTHSTGTVSGVKQVLLQLNGVKTSKVTLEISSDKGCKDTISRIIKTHPKPELTVLTKDHCFGDSSYFSSTATIDSGIISSYFWDFGDGSNSRLEQPVHYYKKAGKYKITTYLFSDKGCKDTVITNIEIFDSPKAFFQTDNKDFPTFCFENLTNPDADKYSWGYYHKTDIVKTKEGFKLNKNSISKDSFCNKYDSLGTYWVCLVAHSNKGCNDTFCNFVTIDLIKEIKLSNVFTPGLKDGKNDEFVVPMRGHDVFEIKIFNRYGVQVFESKDPAYSWNGNVKNVGIACPPGQYYYELKYSFKRDAEIKTVKGAVYLIRE